MVVFEKPKALTDAPLHYCPGCTHGIIHRLVAEAIDYNEAVIGKRAEGTIYGTFNLARRIGGGIGQGLLIKMLAWFDYDAALSEAGLIQSDFTVLGIHLSNALLPALFVLGSWIAFKFIWKITPEIKEKIAQKKEAERRLIENIEK